MYMGKFHRTLKQEQLRTMLSEKRYLEALDITNEIFKTTNVNELSDMQMYAEVYRCNKKYDKAKELYYVIYDELRTRRSLYNLLDVCIVAGDMEEAEELYEEYVEKDPDSVERYILRYRMDKVLRVDRTIIITDLQNIKKAEYMEDMGYELAYQYAKAGMVNECIAECRDILIWFGEGEYVDKARALLNGYMENGYSDGIGQTYEYNYATEETYITEEADVTEETDITEETDVTEETGITEETDMTEETGITEETDMVEEDQTPQVSAYGNYVKYVSKSDFLKTPEALGEGSLNFVVVSSEGNDVTGTVQLIIKIIKKLGRFTDPRIVKINASKLNTVTVDVEELKLLDSCIMIEEASKMSAKTINSIIKAIDAYPDRIAFIFTDSEEAMSKMLFREEILKNQVKYFVLCE